MIKADTIFLVFINYLVLLAHLHRRYFVSQLNKII